MRSTVTENTTLERLIHFLSSTKLDWMEGNEIYGREGVASFVRMWGLKDSGWQVDFCFGDKGQLVSMDTKADYGAKRVSVYQP